MTIFLLSANPNVTFDPRNDTLRVDTASAAQLSLIQIPQGLLISDGLHVANLRGALLADLALPLNIVFNDGSLLLVGDNRTGGIGDDATNIWFARDADDQVFGMGSTDFLDGGRGHDRIYGNLGNDLLFGSVGNDTLHGGQGDDLVNGGPGDNFVHGNLGNDNLFADEGNDTVFGGGGNDTILAGGGFNLIVGDEGDDSVVGAQGATDTVFGGEGRDTINYSVLVMGNAAVIYGNAGDDLILGGNGRDTLFGGQGRDLLTGNRGSDVLSGGLGSDTFMFQMSPNRALADTGSDSYTADVITDFDSGRDSIKVFFSGIYSPGTSTNYVEYSDPLVTSVETAIHSHHATSKTHGFYTFIAGSSDGYLVVDTSPNGGPDLVVVLHGIRSLNQFDYTDIQ